MKTHTLHLQTLYSYDLHYPCIMTTMGAILGSQWSTVLSDWPLAPQLDQMLADHVALQSTLTAQFVTTFSAGRVIIVLHHCIFCSNLPPDTWPLTGRPFRASAIDSLSSMSQECQWFIFNQTNCAKVN